MNKQKIIYYFLLLLLPIVGSLATVSVFGTLSDQIEAFEFTIEVQIFDHGQTEIKLPPLGSISAGTHQTPLKFILTLTNIDLDGIKSMLDLSVDEIAYIDGIRTDLEDTARKFTVRLLLLAIVGGGLGVTILSRDRKVILTGMLIGLLLVGSLLYASAKTYDLEKFENPEFQGVLETAPWMISFIEEALVKVDELSLRLEIISQNLYQVYQTLDTLEPTNGIEADFKVLHVSDIHNNPAAFSFIEKITRNFGVDFIINTGDETDFGTTLESAIFQQIELLEVPYLFLGGNHDSPETLNDIAELENVILMDNQVVEIMGLRIIGYDDPASQSLELTPLSKEDVLTEAEVIRRDLKGKKVDIIAVHNHNLAKELAGEAPIIMHGHDHSYSITKINGSIILDAGTTGASGIRGLQTVNESPYTVLLLYFAETENNSLLLRAVDIFKVYNLRSGFTLERNIVNIEL